MSDNGDPLEPTEPGPPTDDDVRNGLAEVLASIEVNDETIHAYAYPPGQPQTPLAMVSQVHVEFDEAYGRGSDRFVAVVTVSTGGELQSAMQTLSRMAYLVKDAVWNEPTLAGTVADARVTRKRGDSERLLSFQGVELPSVDVEVEAWT
jgi:hypothetical protein